MKFICEITKKDFEDYDILDYSVNELQDKISHPDELIKEIENNIDNYCFSDLNFAFIDTEVKIDGLSVEDFLNKNKDEIWEIFKRDYPEMVEKKITEVNCCYNCKQFGKADLRINPEWGYCFLRKEKTKPNHYCKDGSFKD